MLMLPQRKEEFSIYTVLIGQITSDNMLFDMSTRMFSSTQQRLSPAELNFTRNTNPCAATHLDALKMSGCSDSQTHGLTQVRVHVLHRQSCDLDTHKHKDLFVWSAATSQQKNKQRRHRRRCVQNKHFKSSVLRGSRVPSGTFYHEVSVSTLDKQSCKHGA